MADDPDSDTNTMGTSTVANSDTSSARLTPASVLVGPDAGTIAPDGDLILVVGVAKSRFRVDSRCLSAASKVFQSMFSSKWSEGRNLSCDNPKDIPLPDDDPFAIHVICCVIHHRNDLVPDSLVPRQLLAIAIAADKYNLGVALQFAKAAWLGAKGNSEPDVIYDGYRLAAAFAFKDLEKFAKISFELMVNHYKSYIPLYKEKALRDILPKMTPRMSNVQSWLWVTLILCF